MTLHWPQITWIVLAVIQIIMGYRNYHRKIVRFDATGRAVRFIVNAVLLYFGGFFGPVGGGW